MIKYKYIKSKHNLKKSSSTARTRKTSRCKPFWNLFNALRAGLQAIFRFRSVHALFFKYECIINFLYIHLSNLKQTQSTIILEKSQSSMYTIYWVGGTSAFGEKSNGLCKKSLRSELYSIC